MTRTADVVVIGLGPGGEAVAGSLAEAGLDVVAVERRLVGGECPYWGCVPSKMMIRAANLLAEARRVDGVAGSATVTPDWAPVARRIREQATDNWNDDVAVKRLEGKGATVIHGEGRFVDARRVAVGGDVFEARRGVVLATGTSPAIPAIPGLASVRFWTNHEAIETDTLPGSLTILGGGAIGAELAQVFARFGVAVVIVEGRERVLPLEEPEAGAEIGAVFEREGIRVVAGEAAARVDQTGNEIRVELADGTILRSERLLVATGRRNNLDALDLTVAGLDPEVRSLSADSRMRVAPGIWAIGDIAGHGAFTHMSMYQARIATADILGRGTETAQYRAVPRVTFTDPEVGAVGLTAAEAAATGVRVRTGMSRVSSSARGWIHGPGNDGFIKLVEDGERGVLVGATSVGPVGGEVLSMLALAVHEQTTTRRLREMIYTYPTFHRGVEDALRSLMG